MRNFVYKNWAERLVQNDFCIYTMPKLGIFSLQICVGGIQHLPFIKKSFRVVTPHHVVTEINGDNSNEAFRIFLRSAKFHSKSGMNVVRLKFVHTFFSFLHIFELQKTFAFSNFAPPFLDWSQSIFVLITREIYHLKKFSFTERGIFITSSYFLSK